MAKFHTLGANSDIVTAGEVVPAEDADLTRAIATIGGKAIKIPEGGGGGSGAGVFFVESREGDLDSGSAGISLNGISIVQRLSRLIFKKGSETLYSKEPDRIEYMLLPVPPDGKLTVILDGIAAVYKNGQVVPSGDCEVSAGDVFLLEGNHCLLDTTPILMADGTEKAIRDLRAGDLVMAVDPATGALAADRVTLADGAADKRHGVKDVWTFDDGTVVETVRRHRFYNVELREPMYLEAWENGERAFRRDGATPRLVGHERQAGDWRHCTLFTERWNNYFAGGLLCGNRRSSKLNIGG